MSTVSDNDDAPQPNHALVASLLPTIRPPKALETPDGHTKRSTAQLLVIGKTLSLCLMAGILGAVYAFGELTSGTGSLKKLSFSIRQSSLSGSTMLDIFPHLLRARLLRPTVETIRSWLLRPTRSPTSSTASSARLLC